MIGRSFAFHRHGETPGVSIDAVIRILGRRKTVVDSPGLDPYFDDRVEQKKHPKKVFPKLHKLVSVQPSGAYQYPTNQDSWDPNCVCLITHVQWGSQNESILEDICAEATAMASHEGYTSGYSCRHADIAAGFLADLNHAACNEKSETLRKEHNRKRK